MRNTSRRARNIMTIRHAYRAGSFYPADEQTCHRQIAECLGDYRPPQSPTRVVAGLVPHAGWMFSGPTAAKVFKSIQEKSAPATFLIFGAVHVWGVGRKAALCDAGAWLTPCGTAKIDEALAAAVLEDAADLVVADPAAHEREHSIEVQIPFIQYLFPDAKILPIMVAPDTASIRLGQTIGETLARWEHPVCVLGSTDLTHYGPSFGFTSYGVGDQALARMKANDAQLLELVAELKAAEVIAEAERHRNACGAGAIAATLAAAKALGATRGYLLEHTTSHEVMPERPAADMVGYAGMIF